VLECNGHDVAELRRVLGEATRLPANQPRVVICHTVKGKGVPQAENNADWHHRSNMSEEVLNALRTAGRT
jgi:transketolase